MGRAALGGLTRALPTHSAAGGAFASRPRRRHEHGRGQPPHEGQRVDVAVALAHAPVQAAAARPVGEAGIPARDLLAARDRPPARQLLHDRFEADAQAPARGHRDDPAVHDPPREGHGPLGGREDRLTGRRREVHPAVPGQPVPDRRVVGADHGRPRVQGPGPGDGARADRRARRCGGQRAAARRRGDRRGEGRRSRAELGEHRAAGQQRGAEEREEGHAPMEHGPARSRPRDCSPHRGPVEEPWRRRPSGGAVDGGAVLYS